MSPNLIGSSNSVSRQFVPQTVRQNRWQPCRAKPPRLRKTPTLWNPNAAEVKSRGSSEHRQMSPTAGRRCRLVGPRLLLDRILEFVHEGTA